MRRSLAEGIFGRMAARRGSSSTIKRSSTKPGLELRSLGSSWRRSSRPMTSSKAIAGLSRWFRRAVSSIASRSGLQLLFRLLEFVVQLNDLIERSGLFLWLAGLLEKGEQLIGARDRRGAELDRIVLFCRDKKVALFLEQLLGRVPPAFEFRLTERRRPATNC